MGDGWRRNRLVRLVPWVLPVLVLGALQLVAVTTVQSTSDVKAADRWFPRTVGTTWVYTSRSNGQDTGTHTAQVVSIGATSDGVATVVESRWDNLLGRGPATQFAYQGVTDDGLVLHGARAAGSYISYEPPQPQWERSLAPGESFTWAGKFGMEEQRITTTFEAEETVVVAGERHEGCRHYRTATVVTTDAGEVERSYEAWLCPEIGPVRTREAAPDAGVLLEEDLVAFRSPTRRLGTVDAISPGPAHPGETPGVDDARSGAVPGEAVDLSRLAWSAARKEAVKFPPVGRQDLLVLAEQDGTVSAMNPSTGAVRWRVTVPGPVPVSPVVRGDVVVTAGADKTLSALDTGTGLARWSVRLADVPAVAPLVTADTIVLAGQDRRVRALQLGDGRELWQAQTGDVPASPPALAGGIVVVADKAGGVTGLRLSDGATQWSAALERRWAAGPSTAGDRVVVMDRAGIVSAFDSVSGQLSWSRYVELDVAVPLVVTGDLVLLVPNGDRIQALDRRDGSFRWLARLGAETTVAPLGVGDSLLVVTGDAKVQRRSLADGSLVESVSLPAPTAGSAVRAELTPVWIGGHVVVTIDVDLPWPRTNLLAYGPVAGVRLTGEMRPISGLLSGQPRLSGTDLLLPAGDQTVKVLSDDGDSRTLLSSEDQIPFAIPAGDVVLTQQGEELVAVPAAGGEPRWRLPAGPPMRGTEPVVAGDTVIAPVSGVGLVSVELATGRPRWIHPIQNAQGTGAPVVLPGGDVVHAVGGLVRLDGRTGQPRWSVPGVTVFGPITVADSVVVAAAVTETGSSLLATDVATGAERWRRPFNPSLLVGPAARGDVVVAVDAAGNAMALDTVTGRPRWSYAMRTAPGGTPVILGDRVVFYEAGREEDLESRDTRLSVHDLRTGRYLASLEPFGFSFVRGTFGATDGAVVLSTGTVVMLLRMQ